MIECHHDLYCDFIRMAICYCDLSKEYLNILGLSRTNMWPSEKGHLLRQCSSLNYIPSECSAITSAVKYSVSHLRSLRCLCIIPVAHAPK